MPTIRVIFLAGGPLDGETRDMSSDARWYIDERMRQHLYLRADPLKDGVVAMRYAGARKEWKPSEIKAAMAWKEGA